MSQIAFELFVCKRNYIDTLHLYGATSISCSWALGALRAQAAYLIQETVLKGEHYDR